jgi:hypothetical protein
MAVVSNGWADPRGRFCNRVHHSGQRGCGPVKRYGPDRIAAPLPGSVRCKTGNATTIVDKFYHYKQSLQSCMQKLVEICAPQAFTKAP